MAIEVMLAVLLGALLHAGWNALIRGAADRTRDTVLVATGAAAIAACALPVLPPPATASWPYLAASGIIHVAYFLLVAGSYRHGELSFVYPLMRGSAPVISAVAAMLLLNEMPTASGWLGVLLISGGVLFLAGDSWRARTFHGGAALFALSTAGIIAIYTLVDGAGVRLSGNAASYTCWVLLLTALPLLGIFLLRDRAATTNYVQRHWRRGLLGGGCTLASYALALWAMTQAPIAMVAALRETSVVFAAIIAMTLLGERVSRIRGLSILIVAAGAVAIKLA
ncbi:MAG: EamA family transporter [Betaproteobacteria bacterium]|nr:EamA family transporter [Betaproteobacteria bacterium]MDH5344056.1 EamA family transporter [Betaproteobacteria bacterium]